MSRAKSFADSFMMHRSVLPAIVDELNDQAISFQPWDNAMTTGGLIWHMLTVNYAFASAAATGTFQRVTESPAFHTLTDVKQAIDDWTQKTVDHILSMRDEQFDALIDVQKIFGQSVPASMLLNTMRDHEIHHKGQLFVYARMSGAKQMPMFVNRNV